MRKEKQVTYYVVYIVNTLQGSDVRATVVHTQHPINRIYQVEKIKEELMEELPNSIGPAELTILSWTELGAK